MAKGGEGGFVWFYEVSEEDPSDLIREVIEIEKEIAKGLENLLREVEK